MIIHDAGAVPGMDLDNANVYGKRFSDGKVNLTVLLINRQPLEQLIGADLIYYNETFKAFVLIQYKALEKEGSADVFRLPNKDLESELTRMHATLSELAGHSDVSAEPECFRLNSNPFYLKFCPRSVKAATSSDLFSGFYVPLGYFDLLTGGSHLAGPKGGKSLSYKNVQRWLTNGDFIPLVRNGWVGTTPAQSSLLQKVVVQTLEGRSGRDIRFGVEGILIMACLMPWHSTRENATVGFKKRV